MGCFMRAQMTISKLAKVSGVGIETIRYYEREGLIAQPKVEGRSSFRKYDDLAVQRIAFIKRAKSLGFSLAEIRDLLALKTQPQENCARVKEKTERKIEEIERKIVDLAVIRDALKVLSSMCHSDNLTSECNILMAMDSADKNQ